MESENYISTYAGRARAAYRILAQMPDARKRSALESAADALEAGAAEIITANGIDLELARKSGHTEAFLDRLSLDAKRIKAIADGVRSIAALPDPVGRILAEWERADGLKFQRVTLPIGVIGMIYESRPNVTADAATLCVKSGNAVILRGGSESFNSSRAIAECIRAALLKSGLPEDALQMVESRDRRVVTQMLEAAGQIDVIIPRGGKSLTKKVMEESRVPTILHLDGNCHVYIHEKATLETAVELVYNSKMRRTGICGAAESLLIDKSALDRLLNPIITRLIESGCEIRGDDDALAANGSVKAATEEDWGTEYLAPIISIKAVSGLDEAIEHINRYGSHHTDCIITEDADAATCFLNSVDSAIVLHNASTQFADGGEFGFGGEIGIATGRLPPRGPVALEQLVTYKYLVRGNGHVRG